MAILKFKTFEEIEELERKGKGIKWNFKPDANYIKSVLMFTTKIPFPPGVYKFKSFDEAEKWEREWLKKQGFEGSRSQGVK